MSQARQTDAKDQTPTVIELPKNRQVIIRQDRVDLTNVNAWILVNSDAAKILNISPFGVAAAIPSNSTRAYQPNTEVTATLVIEDFELGTYRFRVARAQTADIENPEIGLETVGESISTNQVRAILDTLQIKQKLQNISNSGQLVPVELKAAIYDARHLLENLRREINQLQEANINDARSNEEYQLTIIATCSRYISEVFPAFYRSLDGIFKKVTKSQRAASVAFFREQLQDIIYQSPFADRVYNKPLGYAGDFEMMNIIYRNEPVGKTLFAKCLHKYWVEEPSARAVRNRALYLKEKITNLIQVKSQKKHHTIKILSVACGPAFEWELILKEKNELLSSIPIELHLFDQDPNALKEAQRRLHSLIKKYGLSNIQIKLINNKIQHLLIRGAGDKYSIIYSAGLFDYLTDTVATHSSQKLYESLEPSGELVIGNFNIDNPNLLIMDLALDWHLIYRSPEELKNILAVPGSKTTVESEQLDINLFCVIKKPE